MTEEERFHQEAAAAEAAKHQYCCEVCGHRVYWSVEDAASYHETEPFLPCGHDWKDLKFTVEQDEDFEAFIAENGISDETNTMLDRIIDIRQGQGENA